MLESTTSALKLAGELLGFLKRMPRGAWRSVAAPFHRRSVRILDSLEDGVLISVDRVGISLESSTTGELMLYLIINNFLRSSVTIDSLTIDYWLFQNQVMPEPHVIFKSVGTIVDRQARVLVKIRLYEKEIAQVMNTVPNGWSIPETLVRDALFDISLRLRPTAVVTAVHIARRLENTSVLVTGAGTRARSATS